MTEAERSQFDAGILKALIDFKFLSFATPKLVRILYLLSFISVCAFGLFFFIGGLISGSAVITLATLVVVPLVTLLTLIYIRVSLELLQILFNIGDNTSTMISQLRSVTEGD